MLAESKPLGDGAMQRFDDVLFEHATSGLALCRMDGTMVRVNLAYAQILGRGISQTLGLTYWQITPESYAEQEAVQLKSLEDFGHYGPYEKEYIHADGHLVPVRLSGRIVEFGGERLIWSSAEDITERKRLMDASEAARREATKAYELLDKVFDRVNDGIVALDNNWCYTYVNARAARMLQREKPEDLIGKHIWTEYPQGIGQPFHNAYLKAAQTQLALVFDDHYEPWDLWFENRVYPSPDGLTIYFTEVTERKRAQAQIQQLNVDLEKRVAERTEQLAAANRELETFAYSVSHDLKAPLRGIDGYSQLLQETCAAELSEDGRLFLQNIRDGSAQMNALIDDLLDYSRMERRQLRSMRLDLDDAVRSALAERASEIEARGVRLQVELPALSVQADPDGLAVALRNLLENALKFTNGAKPPVIEVGGREESNTCFLWVKDNGIGFDMKFHDRIFEIFQRLQRTEDYPGTGIGLALVSKAMHRMGGRVWAQSVPGQGATFYLELPK